MGGGPVMAKLLSVLSGTAVASIDLPTSTAETSRLRSSMALALLVFGGIATVAWSALLAWIVIRFLILTLW